jgi:hypothetical protein
MFTFCGFVKDLVQVYKDSSNNYLVFDPQDKLMYSGVARGDLVTFRYYIPNMWIDSRVGSFEFEQKPDGSFRYQSLFGSNVFYPDNIMIMSPLDDSLKFSLSKLIAM